MKIEIQPINDDPANTMLHVYDGGTKPICSIYEEDFVELLNGKQYNQFEKGKISFDIPKYELLRKAKTILQ